MQVPSATSLDDIYPADAIQSQAERWKSLLSRFEQKYGHPAQFVSRSPGRVNIIGEHIDYELYDVFPMAVTVDILVAVAIVPDKPKFTLANVNDKFPLREFDATENGEIHIDASGLEWSNYFKAGLRGAFELLKEKGKSMPPVGMEVMVDGTVPAGSGLSSSSAFVCAAALAAMVANGEETIDKTQLCELSIIAERAVGVHGGGMDQSASIFSVRDSATYISFLPSLKATPIKFPETDPELTFVVAQTFVQSDKQVTAPVCYNLRVTECLLAALVLAKAFGLKKELPKDKSSLGQSLRGFQDIFFAEKEGVVDNTATSIPNFQAQLAKLETLVADYLPQEEGYTREQIAGILGLSVDELTTRYMSKFPIRADRFLLRQRALHVFSEAGRVLKFRQTLSSPPSEGGGNAVLKELGNLMNESQDSCRDVYDCSCPELDELCELARGAGSVGSRLTGAGWGGCSVHLVPKNKVDAVTKAWVEKYYTKKWPDISEERLKEAIVVSKPGSGSYIFRVTGNNVV